MDERTIKGFNEKLIQAVINNDPIEFKKKFTWLTSLQDDSIPVNLGRCESNFDINRVDLGINDLEGDTSVSVTFGLLEMAIRHYDPKKNSFFTDLLQLSNFQESLQFKSPKTKGGVSEYIYKNGEFISLTSSRYSDLLNLFKETFFQHSLPLHAAILYGQYKCALDLLEVGYPINSLGYWWFLPGWINNSKFMIRGNTLTGSVLPFISPLNLLLQKKNVNLELLAALLNGLIENHLYAPFARETFKDNANAPFSHYLSFYIERAEFLDVDVVNYLLKKINPTASDLITLLKKATEENSGAVLACIKLFHEKNPSLIPDNTGKLRVNIALLQLPPDCFAQLVFCGLRISEPFLKGFTNKDIEYFRCALVYGNLEGGVLDKTGVELGFQGELLNAFSAFLSLSKTNLLSRAAEDLIAFALDKELTLQYFGPLVQKSIHQLNLNNFTKDDLEKFYSLMDRIFLLKNQKLLSHDDKVELTKSYDDELCGILGSLEQNITPEHIKLMANLLLHSSLISEKFSQKQSCILSYRIELMENKKTVKAKKSEFFLQRSMPQILAPLNESMVPHEDTDLSRSETLGLGKKS